MDNLVDVVHLDALGAHSPGDFGEARVLQVDTHVAVAEPEDLMRK